MYDNSTEQEERNGIDQKAGLTTAMNNKGLYGELLRRFLQNQSNFYQHFSTLYANEEILLAIHCVHSLKGLAGNIGAKALEKSAAKLEYELQHSNESKIVESLLNDTNTRLEYVLEEIRNIEENFPQPHCIYATLDTLNVQRLWKKLEEELRNYDASASDTMEILAQQPCAQDHYEDVTLLIRAIVNYQFEEALAYLQRITIPNITKA